MKWSMMFRIQICTPIQDLIFLILIKRFSSWKVDTLSTLTYSNMFRSSYWRYLTSAGDAKYSSRHCSTRRISGNPSNFACAQNVQQYGSCIWDGLPSPSPTSPFEMGRIWSPLRKAWMPFDSSSYVARHRFASSLWLKRMNNRVLC